MSPTKQKALLQGLNGVARKVYDVVPVNEPWTLGLIIAELQRKGVSLEYRVAQGCLRNLVGQGLVIESEDQFQRREIKARPTLKAVETPPHSRPDALSKPPATPLDRLGEIANWVEGVCKDLHLLKGELETVAIEVQQYLEDIQAKNTKLKQLQDLLKGLAD